MSVKWLLVLAVGLVALVLLIQGYAGVPPRTGLEPTENATGPEAASQQSAGEYDQLTFFDGGVPAPAEIQNPGSCGNGFCEEGELCSSCEVDCGCLAGNYCNRISNSCVAEATCGDGICVDAEKNGVCAIDCGCPSTGVYNPILGKCISKLNISKAILDAAISSYVEKHPSFKVVEIGDSFYGKEAAKSVLLDCNGKIDEVCETTIVIDKSGKIVSEAFVS